MVSNPFTHHLPIPRHHQNILWPYRLVFRVLGKWKSYCSYFPGFFLSITVYDQHMLLMPASQFSYWKAFSYMFTSVLASQFIHSSIWCNLKCHWGHLVLVQSGISWWRHYSREIKNCLCYLYTRKIQLLFGQILFSLYSMPWKQFEISQFSTWKTKTKTNP